MVREDDIYELTEDDAVDTPGPTDERRPADEALEQLDDDGHTYALGDEVVPPPRGDTAILDRPPRYCLACNFDLTLVETGVCPGCEKAFDPADPKTYRDEPLSDEPNWWLEPPRLATYVWLPLFLLGRWVVGGLGEAWGGDESRFVIGAAMVALTVPWAVGCILCLLIALQDHYNPKLSVTVPLAIGLGAFVALGSPALVVVVAALCGPFVGVLWTWKTA